MLVDDNIVEGDGSGEALPPVNDAVTVERISNNQPQVNTIMTIGEDQHVEPAGYNTTFSSVVLGAPASAVVEDTNSRKVVIGYPKGYKGTRYMKDGEVKTVSKEVADKFIKDGIATLVKKTKSNAD
jgi:hypothetical protein